MNIKNSKFWIWYIPFLIIICITIWGLLMTSKAKNNTIKDSEKFMNEYAELNGKTNESNGSAYPIVSLDKNNPFVYATDDDIKNLFTSGTGVIYFGFPECPWCRNLVPVLNNSIASTSISKVYYYNIKNIRSKITANDDGTLANESGTDFYYYLLNKLDAYLTEYKVKNSKGKEIDTNEKRLYAPTIVFVKDGEVIGIHEGTIDAQTDPYNVLNDSEKEELASELQEYLSKITESCDEKC
jgi:thiol-disulfide isomerase/thioredoxin